MKIEYIGVIIAAIGTIITGLALILAYTVPIGREKSSSSVRQLSSSEADELRGEIDSLDKKIDSLRFEFSTILKDQGNQIDALDSDKSLFVSVTDSSGSNTLPSRCLLQSLSPRSVQITIPKTGLYSVAFSGRLRGLSVEDNYWVTAIYSTKNLCVLSSAFGSGYIPGGHFLQGETSAGNTWIGTLTEGDVIQLRFFVHGFGKSVLAAGDNLGVDHLHALYLAPATSISSASEICVTQGWSECR
jgi:hypothetical protein